MDIPAVPTPIPIPSARTITQRKRIRLLPSPPQKLKIHRKEEVEEGYKNSTLPQQNCIISGDTIPKIYKPPQKNLPQASGGGLHKLHTLTKIELQKIQCPYHDNDDVIESLTPPKGGLILNLLNFSPCKNALQS